MTKENLKVWDTFADIDPAFTKAITGKPYSGTSPNPQYVIKCLTELFGPIGIGFGWTVVAEEFTPLGDEVLHWCRIDFWHTNRANTFSAYGQTKAVMATKNGLKMDEDAPKKSLTDAIVKAASQLGIAANIFLGRWDDSRYVAGVRAEYEAEKAEAKKPEQPKLEPTPENKRKWLVEQIAAKNTDADLTTWWNGKAIVDLRGTLSDEMQQELLKTFSDRFDALSQKVAAE